MAAAKKAGVGHYVALSIVGTDGLPDSGYLRAKVAQEKMITESGLPYTIVRATQFAGVHRRRSPTSLIVGDEVRVPDALIQPIAARDVAAERGAGRRRRAAQRHREHRWAGKDLVRARWPATREHPGGPAVVVDPRRRTSALRCDRRPADATDRHASLRADASTAWLTARLVWADT